MAITVIASVKGANSGGGTTAAIDTTGASLLVIATKNFTTGDATVSDSKGNTWTGLTKKADGASAFNIRFYYAVNPTVGSGHTFTAAGGITYGMYAVAFSGIATSTPFDQENGAAGAALGTSVQTGAVVPSTNGQLILSSVQNIAGDTDSIDSSLSIIEHDGFSGGTTYGGAIAWYEQPTAASINPTWSWTGGSDSATVIATFKASTGGTTNVERSATDSYALSDLIALILGFLSGSGDSFSIADAFILNLTSHFNFDDTVSLIDDNGNSLGVLVGLNDGVTLLDAIATFAPYGFSANDFVTITDSIAPNLYLLLQFGDAISFSDFVIAQLNNLTLQKIPYHMLVRGLKGTLN